jgi:flagellar basal body-associated protein FliL
VGDEAEEEDKSGRKSRKPLLWITLLILTGAAAYSVYLYLVKQHPGTL